MRPHKSVVMAAFLIVLALSAGCSGEPEPIEITADRIAWSHSEMRLLEGQEAVLHIHNDDHVPHLFTSEDLGIGHDADALIEPNSSVSISFTPEAAGTFEFWCKLHPKVMRGTIVVEEA